MFGHDVLCPRFEDAVVPWKPNGQWPAGVSGNAYGPRRLRAARALMAELSDNGRTFIERLTLMAGLPLPGMPSQSAETAFPPSVQVRAMQIWKDIFFGKQIRVSGKVKSEHTLRGVIEHAIASPELAARLQAMTEAELEQLEAAHAVLTLPARQPIEDAVVEDE